MPLVSVIMPCYNTEEMYFKNAVSSILAQTMTDFELIIIDDASLPYIQEIANSFLHDKRIGYHRFSQNKQAPAARNFGISIAKGKYIAFLDSDDSAHPERLQKQVDFLENNPQVGVLASKVAINNSTSTPFSFKYLETHDAIRNQLIFKNNILCQSSIMLRKKLLTDNNIFYATDLAPIEDYALWLSLLNHTKFHILNEELTTYNFYAENLSNRNFHKNIIKNFALQFDTINALLDNKLAYKDKWLKICQNQLLSKDDFNNINQNLREVSSFLEKETIFPRDGMYIFKNCYKFLYKNTLNLSGQLFLFFLPINKTLRIPFYWKISSLITRGLF